MTCSGWTSRGDRWLPENPSTSSDDSGQAKPSTAEGANYTLKEARLAVRPVQDPHPPISIAVASVEAAMAIGELGYGIQIGGPPDVMQEHIDAYRESCPEGFGGHVGILRNVLVREEAVDGGRARAAMEVFARLLTGQESVDRGTLDFFVDRFGLFGSCADVTQEI